MTEHPIEWAIRSTVGNLVYLLFREDLVPGDKRGIRNLVYRSLRDHACLTITSRTALNVAALPFHSSEL